MIPFFPLPRLARIWALVFGLWVIIGFANIGTSDYIQIDQPLDTPAGDIQHQPRPLAPHNEGGDPGSGDPIVVGPGAGPGGG